MEERAKHSARPQKTAGEGIIAGRNAVGEAFRAQREIDSIYIQRGERKGSVAKLAAIARDRGIPVKEADSRKLEELAGGENHQGIVAVAAAASYATVEEILQRAEGEPPFLVLADRVEDPHNLGAIIRTAEAAGAHGLIIPKRHSAGLTAAVARTSAGAVEHLPVARVPNLAAAIEELKKKNIWVYCADMGGPHWCSCDLTGGVALVVGSEGFGVSRVVREACDGVLSLPMLGKVTSLNASVAAGIVLYEIARQRQGIAAYDSHK